LRSVWGALAVRLYSRGVGVLRSVWGALAVRLYSRGVGVLRSVWGALAVRRANSYQKEKTKTARRCGRAVWVLFIRFYALAVASAFLRARYSL